MEVILRYIKYLKLIISIKSLKSSILGMTLQQIKEIKLIKIDIIYKMKLERILLILLHRNKANLKFIRLSKIN